MAKVSVHVAYYMFLLTFCVDEGDGLWKKTDSEILQRDIKLYKKIAGMPDVRRRRTFRRHLSVAHESRTSYRSETSRTSPKIALEYKRVEHELQEYFTEYDGHKRFRLHVNRNSYETYKQIPKRSAKLHRDGGEEKKGEQVLSKLTKTTNYLPIYNKKIANDSISSDEIGGSKILINQKGSKSKWPKFKEILLAIGKKYDWKNDRWIKVKEKFKIKDEGLDEVDNNIFHEKHRFSYRSIKLNRGKNKRNVVIAVTAVR